MKHTSFQKSLYVVLLFSALASLTAMRLLPDNKPQTGILVFNPQWNEKGTTFRHTWEGYASIDQARWLSRGDMQEQIALAHRELNVNNLRTVSMLDDEMRVWCNDPRTWRDKDRKPRMNFRMLDYAFESLLKVGVKPVVSTNFMPTLMAASSEIVFKTGGSAPPLDYKEWENLITSLTQHLFDYFGEEVVNWDFEVWNEPNLDYFWKGANKEEFFKLWTITYRAIKSVNPKIRIGGPTTARAEWLPEFIEFSRKNNCQPDYIIVHIYNNDSEFGALSPFDGPQSDKINKSPNFLSAVVKGARKQLNELNYTGELYFNEWGSSWFPTDDARETQNEAAFIVKSMAECSQYADRLTYWCLSDIFDQAGFAVEAFYGGFGLLSMDGLRKPSYKAFQLLGKLGDTQVSIKNSDNNVMRNAIATKSPEGYQFLFYAMEKVFNQGDSIKTSTVSVLLPEGVNESQISLFQIGETDNNILAEWKKMGKPSYLKKEQLTALKNGNDLRKMNQKPKMTQTKEGKILSFEAELPGVVLVEIFK